MRVREKWIPVCSYVPALFREENLTEIQRQVVVTPKGGFVIVQHVAGSGPLFHNKRFYSFGAWTTTPTAKPKRVYTGGHFRGQ